MKNVYRHSSPTSFSTTNNTTKTWSCRGFDLLLSGHHTILLPLLTLFAFLTIGSANLWGQTTYEFINQSTGKYTGYFYTGRAESNIASESYTIAGKTFAKYVILAGTGAPGVANTDRYIQYDVKTTSTRIVVYVKNNSTSTRNVNIGEFKEGKGSGETIRTKTIGKSATDTIIYNATNTTNSTIYITVPSSVGDVRFCQVEATESGTAIGTGASIGYVLDLNKGRLSVKSGTLGLIDGIEVFPNGDYTAASSTYLKIKTSGTNYVKFTPPANCKLSVTTNTTNKTYYINTTKGGSTGTAYTTSCSNVELTGGTTYYINPAGSEVQITKLEFSASSASCPTDPTATRGGTEATPAGGVVLGTVLEPLTCTATGTSVTYQWKQNTIGSKDGAVNAVGTGATTASFVPNPASAGTYYYFCVVTDACGNTAETTISGAFEFNTTTYTVTYNGNNAGGGSVPTDGTAYASGASVTVSGNTGSLTRTIDGSAATFYGWDTNSKGFGGTHYDAGATFSITANTTLYAAWGFPISYNTDGGTINDASYPDHYIYTGDETVTAVLPTNVTKSGYTFDGWYTNNGAGSKVTGIEGTYTGAFSGDYALKAKWTESGSGGDDGDCIVLAQGTQNSEHTAITPTIGSITTTGGQASDGYIKLSGSSSQCFVITAKAGYTISAGDKLTVTVYNKNSSATNLGFQIAGNNHTASIPTKSEGTVVYKLVAGDISEGQVTLKRTDSGDRYGAILLERCDDTPCTPIVEPIATGGGTYDVGDEITLTASATSGITAGTTTYTWYRGNSGEAAAIAAGAIQATSTSNTYTISSAEVSDAAVYYCVMSNGGDCSGVGSTSVSINIPAGSYTLTYDANAGGDAVSNLPAPEVHTPGTYTLSSLVPTRAGYTFLCWSRNAAGTNGCFEPGDSFTTGAENETLYAKWEEIPVRECENLFVTEASSTSAMTASVGSATYNISSSGGSFSKGGYSYYVKPNSSNCIVASPKAGSSFAAGDSLIFVVYNPNETPKTMGFKIGSNTYTTSVAAGTLHYFRHTLTAAEIVDGKVTFVRNGGDDRWVEVIIKTCDVLPPCTTPVLPSLSDQTVCAGEDGTAWDATITNAGSLASGETVTYEWKKKGSDAVLATTASYTPTDVTAADGGIYVVTATVSKTGYSDATASAEVTLTVKFTATPMVTMTPSSVAPGETATLTATSSTGATFQWFRCDNAAGDNPVNVGSGASYTTSALAAGMYYFKVVATGDGTNTCGTAESVYPVEVAVPEQCHTYYFFPYAADAGTNDVTNNEDNFFSGVTSGTNNSSTYNFSVDGESLTATKNTGSSSMTIRFTIPAGQTGIMGINCKGSSSKPLYLTHSSGTPQLLVSDNSSYAAFEISNIGEGEWTLTSAGSWVLCGMAVKVCTACDATTMDVSNAAPTYDMSAGGDFTEPTFTVKHNGSALSPQPALSYTSSNSAIATVNETTGALTFHDMTGTVTITATYSGDATYCSSTASYTLTINCGSEEAPNIVADGGTNLAGCNTTITLHAKKQDGTTDFTGGTYQWYRDGEAIDGATAASYTVARAGTYIVTRTGACVQESTNKAVITNTVDEPTVERLVPFQYYHEDKTYTEQMKDRHLFAVHSQGTYEGKSYSMTATRVSDDTDVLSIVEGALWVKPGTGAGVGTDTVMIDLNLLIDQGLTAGDEVRFVCSAIACEAISPVNDNIVLKVIDQTPTLAIICSGADGDGTRSKKNFKYNGDFLTGYNKADLCMQTGGTSFDASQELPLYTALKEHYLITPVNGYAPFELLNYEPFDLLLLTDYPKATVNDLTRNKLDSMYVLVDYRPMLSFKTHMVAKTPSSWAVKGFTTAPTVPKSSQTHMSIVCYAHPMFNALSHLTTDEVSPDHDEEGQMVYKMLSGGGYDDSKGIQGFELSDAGNFVTIAFTHYHATASAPAADGTVTWTAESDDRKLIAACERQTNIEARMILLSINADALCKLTEAGIAMVDSTLQYLLETDPLKVADCSLTFNDNNGTGVWSDPLNWAPRYNQIPNADLGARIIKPCTVDNADAIALSIKIEENGKLIIPATSALTVESTIRHREGRVISAPTADMISIAANASGSGTLILNNITEDTRASVQMHSKASTDGSEDIANWRWQYIGTPFNDITDAMTNYYGSWLYVWNNGWVEIPKSGALQPFAGYCITHPEGERTYSMTGTLATTADQTITVPANQYMVIGNSWTAPIQIDNFSDDDLKNLEARTIYFFNTGSDPNQSGTVQDEGVADAARWAAGTYVPVPIHSAPYTGDATIASMQGFYVVGGASEGSIHLDYDKLVRPKTGQNIVSGPMHAPRRVAADNRPNVVKLYAGGARYDDRLILLEREDFSYGLDDGWDGEKWGGNEAAPMMWTLREDGITTDAVSALPELEGTVIFFQAGEDENYTFRFEYDGMAEPLYLLDTDTKIYTRVLTGNTYTFSTTDKTEHARFILTRSDAPQITTGIGNTNDGSGGRPKKFVNNGKMYIFVNGILYDATGKTVVR